MSVLPKSVIAMFPGYTADPAVTVPKEPVPEIVILPPEVLIVVAPEYVFAFDNVSVPTPYAQAYTS